MTKKMFGTALVIGASRGLGLELVRQLLAAGDRVIAASRDGRLYILALSDGGTIATIDLGSPMSASPAVGGGKVFVATEDGTVAMVR